MSENNGEKWEMTDQEAADNRARLEATVLDLQAQINELKAAKEKKNQRPGIASGTKQYELLTKEMAMIGKVPRQQEDVAKILSRNMEVGERYTEAQVFAFLTDDCGEFPSLTGSKQDPTYIFRYYRGLRKDGERSGYVARGFLRMI